MLNARRTLAYILPCLALAVATVASAQEPPSAPVTLAGNDSAVDALSQRAHDALMAVQRQPSDANIRDAAQAVDALAAVTTPERTTALLFFQARLAELSGDLETAGLKYRAYVDADSGGRYGRIAFQRLRRLPARASARDPDENLMREFELLLSGYAERGSDASVTMALQLLEQATNPLFRADLLIWLGHEHQFQRGEPAISWDYYQQASTIDGLDNRRANAAISAMATLSGAAVRIVATRRQINVWLASNPGVLDSVQEMTVIEELDDQFGNFAARWAAWLTLPLLTLTFVLRRGWRAFRADTRGSWSLTRPLFFIAWMFGVAAAIAYFWHPANLIPIAICAPAVALVHLVGGAIARSGPPLKVAPAIALSLLVALSTLTSMYTMLALADRTAFLGL